MVKETWLFAACWAQRPNSPPSCSMESRRREKKLIRRWQNWMYRSATCGMLYLEPGLDSTIIRTSSFLPQDKVSEFAQMSPQQLLRETQRAAGDEHLTAWHDTLISAGKELKAILQVFWFPEQVYLVLTFSSLSKKRVNNSDKCKNVMKESNEMFSVTRSARILSTWYHTLDLASPS